MSSASGVRCLEVSTWQRVGCSALNMLASDQDGGGEDEGSGAGEDGGGEDAGEEVVLSVE